MDDREFERLLLPKMLAAAESPIDDNLIAAYIDGDLDRAEREKVELSMQRDPTLRLHIEAMQAEAPTTRRALWPLVAVAAAVLVAVGVWQLLPRTAQPLPPLDVRLATLTATLREGEPALFPDFEILGSDELLETAASTRGGLTWVAPRGLLLARPTKLHWSNPPDSSRVEITIKGPDIEWAKVVDGNEVEAPVLWPGRFRVTIRSLDSFAGQKLRRSFEIANDDVFGRHAQALEELKRHAAPDLLPLAKAHYLLRHRLYALAREQAELAARGSGDRAEHAQRLLRHLDVVAPDAR